MGFRRCIGYIGNVSLKVTTMKEGTNYLQGLSFTLYKLTPSQSMNDMWIKFRVSQIIVKASELK